MKKFTDHNLQLVLGSPAADQASFVNENPDENFKGSPRVSLRYQPIAGPDLPRQLGPIVPVAESDRTVPAGIPELPGRVRSGRRNNASAAERCLGGWQHRI